MTEKEKKVIQLREKYFKALEKVEQRYGMPYRTFQNELVKDPSLCSHSDTQTFCWEHDNGYGVQTKITGLMCRVCRARNSWNSSQWISEKSYYNGMLD